VQQFTDHEIRNWEKLQHDLDKTILQYLNDDTCTEIMCNDNGNLVIDRIRGGKKIEGYISPDQAQMILNTMAYSLRVNLNEENPIVSGELPVNGSRFEGNMPPIVLNPTFTIRKRAIAIYTLDQYVESGVITQAQRVKLRKIAEDRKNVVICGGTQSGKTTFGNAFLKEINIVDPKTRMLIIEDTRELQCDVEDLVTLRSTEHTTMQMLLKSALRQRPDRICVGEVRGGKEANLILEAWNTAHNGGILTVHSNSARSAVRRIEQLLMASSIEPIPSFIADAINIIVSIQKSTDGTRKVREILEVSFENGNYAFQEV